MVRKVRKVGKVRSAGSGSKLLLHPLPYREERRGERERGKDESACSGLESSGGSGGYGGSGGAVRRT